jgi:hypothetical protein
MKFGVVLAVVLIGLVQQATKPENGSAATAKDPARAVNHTTAGKKSDPSPAFPTATSGKAPMPAETASLDGLNGDASKTSNEDLDLRARLAWFTAALAVVAVLQFIALLWQGVGVGKMFRSLRHQAHEAEQQRILMDGQIKIMGEQLAAVKELAAATNSTAEAVKETVAVMTGKERARLRIEVEPFYLNLGAPSPVNYTIHHEGLTDAYILDSRAATYVSNSREPDPIASPGRQMSIPSTITPKMPVVEAQDSLYALTGEEVDSIKQLNSFVHFTAYIRYRDMFDGEHEVRLHRVWNIAHMSHLGGEPFTYWESVA